MGGFLEVVYLKMSLGELSMERVEPSWVIVYGSRMMPSCFI